MLNLDKISVSSGKCSNLAWQNIFELEHWSIYKTASWTKNPTIIFPLKDIIFFSMI